MTNPFLKRRITDELVRKSLRECRRRFPDTDFLVLSDLPLAGATVVENGEDIPDVNGGYLLAFEQDDNCANAMTRIVRAGKPYFPCLQYYPVAEYWRTNREARDALALEYRLQTSVEGHKWNTADFVNIVQAIDATRRVPGAYVEVGVFKGNSARVALRYMNQIGLARRCWFLDVFIGFNYSEAKDSVDPLWEGTHEAGTPEAMADELKGCVSQDSSIVINVERNNIISDELPEFGQIAVANLDVDMYEAVKAGLFRLAPLMAQGGILIVEDPGHTPALSGAFHALSEFLDDEAAHGFLPLTMGSGQTFLVKTMSA